MILNAPSLDEAEGTPEKRLRLAVLLNAIIQLRRGLAHPAAREVVGWIRGEIHASHASFSFEGICEALDLDPSALARALLAPFEGAGSMGLVVPRRQVRLEHVQSAPRRYRPRARAITID